MSYDNLIFLHIPKAAGTTFHRILERHYKKQVRHSIYENVEQNVADFKVMPKEKRKEIRLLKGHMPFGLHRYLYGASTYVTLLREPTARVISLYRYALRKENHYLRNTMLSQRLSLGDCIRSEISGEFDNGQVRLLAGYDQSIPFGQCGRSHLEMAKTNIEKYFSVAGVSERFDESVALMAIRLGWQWTPYYQNENVATRKSDAEELDLETHKLIREVNELDYELYQWVVERFDEEVAKEKEMLRDLIDRIHSANSLYRPVEVVRGNIRKLGLPIRSVIKTLVR